MSARMDPATSSTSERDTATGQAARAVDRLARRTRHASFLGAFLRALAAGFLVVGSLVVVARAAFAFEPPLWATVTVPLVVAVVLGTRAARSKGMSRDGAAAWIDAHVGGGGLVVTGMETDDARWAATFDDALERVSPLRRTPRLAVRGPVGASFGSAAFLALALAFEPSTDPPGISPELFETLVENLAEKLQTLEENVELDEELADDLASRMERLKELLEDERPESLYEAIDGLDERLTREADRLHDDLQSASEDLSRAALDAFRDPGAATDALERALSEMRAAGLGKDLPDALRAMLGQSLELPEGSDLDARELLELARELAELIDGKLGPLVDAGLLEPGKLLDAAKFANLDAFLPTGHVCDETCEEGGT